MSTVNSIEIYCNECDKWFPFILATDITTLLTLRFDSSKIRVVVWMGLSLVVWTVIMAVGSIWILRYINWI